MADRVLIDQCFMWCMAKGMTPRKPDNDEQRVLLESAVRDYQWTFGALNERQRTAIAGLGA